nr:unnamed protein product [Callosobruchus analis]
MSHYDSDSEHKYKAEWETHEDFRKWIKPSSHGIHHFKCKICNKGYIGGVAAVKKHSLSKKHSNNMNLRGQSTLSKKVFTIQSNEITKENEISIASFIAEHNLAINVSDHLIELIKSICLSGMEPSQISQMSSDRTKCTSIINNVIGKTSFERLISKLRVSKFSLIVDESTGVSSKKHLALVVRYNNNFKINDEFLGLVLVETATAQNLYNVIVNFFTENNIPYKNNLVGYAADGANAMMGAHNSLKTLLVNDIPDLYTMKCICHSLALCASYASEKLPDDAEKLVRSIYSYMHHSYTRQSSFQEFQIFCNIKPHKVLEQYDTLQNYFRIEAFDQASGADEINAMLSNPLNKIYLLFLEYILPTFTDLNIEFQSENSKIYSLYPRILSACKFLLSCFLKPDYLKNPKLENIQYHNQQNFLPIDDIYLGPKVAAEFTKHNI